MSIKKTILLVIDIVGWAFYNIAQNIKKNNESYNINIITIDDLGNKIKNKEKIDNIDHAIFFFMVIYGKNVWII